jgi:hypothetical protein
MNGYGIVKMSRKTTGESEDMRILTQRTHRHRTFSGKIATDLLCNPAAAAVWRTATTPPARPPKEPTPRPIVTHVCQNIEGVLKIDGEVGDKKTYDPRSYLRRPNSVSASA